MHGSNEMKKNEERIINIPILIDVYLDGALHDVAKCCKESLTST
jgi:hypothetical protein